MNMAYQTVQRNSIAGCPSPKTYENYTFFIENDNNRESFILIFQHKNVLQIDFHVIFKVPYRRKR
jgi:hypothetical protein